MDINCWTWSNVVKESFLRLPSILLAELILYYNQYSSEIVNSMFTLDPNSLTSGVFSFCLSFLALSLCTLILALPLKYVILIYKSISLTVINLYFNKLLVHVHSVEIESQFFKYAFIYSIYSLIVPVIIVFYIDIYRHLILDTKNVHEFYLSKMNAIAYENIDNDVYNSILNEQGLTPLTNDQIQYSLNKRRLFLLVMAFLVIVHNEQSLMDHPISANGDWEGSKRVGSLFLFSFVFWLLVFYDLSSNREQVVFRLYLKIRSLFALVHAMGLNEFLHELWFNVVKVPFMLRFYFILKCSYFTWSFYLFNEYYEKLYLEMQNQTLPQHFTLYQSIKSIFVESNETISEPHVIVHEPSHWEQNLISRIIYYYPLNEFSSSILEYLINYFVLYFKMLTLTFSETTVSIAATTSMIALQFRHFGDLMNKLTRINDEHANNDLVNVGDVASILFFLLSIQSGLSSLSSPQRIEKFYKNYSLLFIAILHYFHTSLDGQLMALSSTSKPMWKSEKHLRVLSVCFSLIIIPCSILIFLWSNFQISTWLFAASAFCIELTIKMSITIFIYAIFIIDSQRVTSSHERIMRGEESIGNNNKDELSDNLDDYVYCVKAIVHVTQFVVALFLLGNGLYILLFESYGTIRAIMMCIHAYFHIWVQANKGWSAFMKRRTAIKKLKSLKIFNAKNILDKSDDQELNELEIGEFERKKNELCAICFCELYAHEARITSCSHFYHSICLRKWLYLQDTCPMCHQRVYPLPNSNPAT